MRSLQTISAAALLVVVFVSDSDARIFGRRNSTATGSHGVYNPTNFSTEKRYSHGSQKLSLQEGIGVSTTEDYRRVSTCICGSTVVADAWCKSSNGLTYRVRFWR